jgi:hypothetical protein
MERMLVHVDFTEARDIFRSFKNTYNEEPNGLGTTSFCVRRMSDNLPLGPFSEALRGTPARRAGGANGRRQAGGAAAVAPLSELSC